VSWWWECGRDGDRTLVDRMNKIFHDLHVNPVFILSILSNFISE
jgi:hypothetical protein